MSDMIKVGIADLKIAKAPQKLTTLGLGSCVGVTIYDPTLKIGGMVHVMLPDSTAIKNNVNKAKFADTGVKELLDQLIAQGCKKSNCVAKIAGGAQMFKFSAQTETLRVGEKNIAAVQQILRELRIPIKASDVGDTFGRTIELNLENGSLLVRTIGKGEKEI
ncbi:MAG: chemotaxis protein CheD [Epulopiscium sp. Nuni2H_MBin001]|nr:MAG: chemotaxis protein CheD [Epulopiscium sp. Nuni2H_MBin001]